MFPLQWSAQRAGAQRRISPVTPFALDTGNKKLDKRPCRNSIVRATVFNLRPTAGGPPFVNKQDTCCKPIIAALHEVSLLLLVTATGEVAGLRTYRSFISAHHVGKHDKIYFAQNYRRDCSLFPCFEHPRLGFVSNAKSTRKALSVRKHVPHGHTRVCRA